MKRVGLITGLGPASTIDYYLGIINGFREIKNNGSYPEIAMFNVDMNRMFEYTKAGDYQSITDYLAESVERLKASGATAAVICCNTLHIVFDQLVKKSSLPLLSIVNATCREIKRRNFKKVLLLGTIFTMNSEMYPKVLETEGVETILPDKAQREQIQSIIFPELEEGIVNQTKKIELISIAEKIIRHERVEAVILGCTELPIMIKPGDLSVELLNTTEIHILDILSYLTGKE